MRLTAAVCLAAGVSMACGSKDPTERVKRNVADREKIAAEGVKLRQQGVCTPDAIAVARDPDRHYLACAGFATASGPNPGLLVFREQHESADDKALFAACHAPGAELAPAVAEVYCKPALERLQAVAGKEREEYVRAGRCRNKALRAAADPDADYFACFGHQLYFEPHIRLAEFRNRFGEGRCSEVQVEIERAEKARRQEITNALKHGTPRQPPAEILSFANAYGVFCTEEPPRGAL